MHDRLRGICWRVADIDATQARLTAAGIDVSEVRTGRKPGTRVMTVRSGTCGVPTLSGAALGEAGMSAGRLHSQTVVVHATDDPVRSPSD